LSVSFEVGTSFAMVFAVEAAASLAWTERLRAWLIRFVTPAVASLLVEAYCLLAES
jgi:hypothetical protein